MQPQQPSKKTVKAKAKVVAKKPTAQSVAAQRTAMIKKMKGDTAKPAAKKVMPKMADGSGKVMPKMGKSEGRTGKGNAVKIEMKTVKPMAMVETRQVSKQTGKPIKGTEKKKAIYNTMADGSGKVSKYPDGSGKIKPTSTAARRASTATAMPKKRKPMTDEEVIRANKGSFLEKGDYYKNKDQKEFENDVYKFQDKAREIKKLQQRQRDRALEKAVSGKMKSGTKKVKC